MGIQLALKFQIAHAHLDVPGHFGIINFYKSVTWILKDVVIFVF